jgi:signal transduction histidine kinase
MPRLDGIEACKRIRALPGGRDTAIIFVTAQRDVDTFDRAVAAGGDDFITKPFRPNELIVRVETALRLRLQRTSMTAELKEQRDALQRLQLQKEQLVAFLVHDLKNPVNAIDLQAQLALRDAAPRTRNAVLAIQRESRALLRMITNLLDIQKADEGRLAPARQPIDTRALVAAVIDEQRVLAAASEVSLVARVEVEVLEADGDLVHRVVANLVDNAIRHAPADSAVEIAIVAGPEVRVSDRGAGVPPDQRAIVFERFQRGEMSATRSNRGLGLAFCKLAAEAHGGRIWIEDAHPGAVFCARFHP